MNKLTVLSAAGFAAMSLSAAVPTVSDVVMTQAENRKVTITYNLTGAPAVVTVDIQTNAGENAWVSIGGRNVVGNGGRGCPQGDVFKRVMTDGSHTITWKPDLSWPDHSVASPNARAVVTAWSTTSTPDYLVFDLTGASEGTTHYYQSEDFLPGGLFGNTEYRTTKLVMRRIPAKDVTWTMGSAIGEPGRENNEDTHEVTLDHDYYFGVFPLTQAQWQNVVGSTRTGFYAVEGAMRPMEDRVHYYNLRECTLVDTPGPKADYRYPNAPNPKSTLGFLRTKSAKAGFEIDFDLPSEAEWEFAARGGVGTGYWPNGKQISNADNDPNFPGRYKYTGGLDAANAYASYPATVGPEGGTAIVGSMGDRNGYGIYDCCGQVAEPCLDYWKKDIKSYNGAVITRDNADTITLVKESNFDDYYHVFKGATHMKAANNCRTAYRGVYTSSSAGWCGNGARIACRAGLE